MATYLGEKFGLMKYSLKNAIKFFTECEFKIVGMKILKEWLPIRLNSKKFWLKMA